MARVLICGDFVDSWRKQPLEALEGLRTIIEDAVEAGIEPEVLPCGEFDCKGRNCSKGMLSLDFGDFGDFGDELRVFPMQ